jgi:hypothetical protein
MSDMLEKIDKYFSENSKEKILEDWKKSEKYDKIGITIHKFMDGLTYDDSRHPDNYYWKDELNKVNKCTQRQDSVKDQLRDLMVISNKFGFYDASDFLKSFCK